VAARNERGQVVLLRVEGGELIGSKPVAEFLPDDRQDEAAQQLWVLAASAKWEYDSFGEPLPEADTLEALAALVPGRGFGG
jgi:hypothetical protein